MTLKERLTQKVGPLPAWAWGVGAAGALWLVMRFRNKGGSDEDQDVFAVDDPAANLYTLGPVAGAGMAPAGSFTENANESYVNPPEWFSEYLYTQSQQQERINQIFEDYIWATTTGTPDPYSGSVDTTTVSGSSMGVGAPASGVSVQTPAAAKKLFTWAEWNAYHSKTDKNFLKIPGATRQGRYYDYLRSHGATTLPGSGAPIPGITAASVATAGGAKPTSTASVPQGASPAASTPASRAADRAKKGIMEFDAWVAYQVKANSKFMSQTTAVQRRDRWRNYVVAHGGQWQ